MNLKKLIKNKLAVKLTALLASAVMLFTTYGSITASALTVKKLTATGGYVVGSSPLASNKENTDIDQIDKGIVWKTNC